VTDYRLVMSLLIQNWSYRQIEAAVGCSHATIAKAKRICKDHDFVTTAQIEQLSAEDLELLFEDGRKAASDEFVGFDIEALVKQRTGKHKPPLRVLWANYLQTGAAAGQRHYSYQRFCKLIGDYVDINDLTMRINHVPGHTMQVDWAGERMAIFDPITGTKTRVSVFVATLPYSGLVFARGYVDEKLPNWLAAHQQAFEAFGGVAQVVIPDNTSTASNQIARGDRAREVNQAYRDFLDYYGTAAVPTRDAAPQDKGSVESGVKVVTHWGIRALHQHRFASLDELNTTLSARVESINARTPFRGQHTSRQELFAAAEQAELRPLPEQPWQPVTWRKAKVNRDYHIELATAKYSVPSAYVGRRVDVKITGERLVVLCDGEVIAEHAVDSRKHVFVTNPDHVPARHHSASDLWSRAYFERQAHKIGPHTVDVITSVLDHQRIEAQGYRSCQNILGLAKGGRNKTLLERACQQLITEPPGRPISYTAVKQRMAALRAQATARPTTQAGDGSKLSPGPGPDRRDTTGAHLAGPERFSLNALLKPTTEQREAGQY
jgi:transposase